MVKALIRIYQLTRFMRPACCRFYPSCSDYCLQAVEVHGLFLGSILTVKRLLKCHPWHPGGIDLIVGVDAIDPRERRTWADYIRPYSYRDYNASTANNGEAP